MNTPDQWHGIVFTSPRAVQAVQAAVDTSVIAAKWSSKKVFAIHGETAAMIQNDLHLQPQETETVNAVELSNYIVECWQSHPWNRPLLFLCGDLRRDELPTRLQQHNIPFTELKVYKTLTGSQPFSLEGIVPSWLVFFSPSGVQSLQQILQAQHQQCSWTTQVKYAAIGETTAQAGDSFGLIKTLMTCSCCSFGACGCSGCKTNTTTPCRSNESRRWTEITLPRLCLQYQ